MTVAAQLPLQTGRVYRIRDLSPWTADTSRLAKRLVAEGALVSLEHGLFVHPKAGRFGFVPPSDEQLLRGFLGSAPFVFTGPEQWNALGLGTIAVFAHTLVYNTRRAGRFVLGGRPFLLRRVTFPRPTPPEWFVVDLLEHAEQAGSCRSELAAALAVAVSEGRFDRPLLRELATAYGSARTARFMRLALSTRP